MSYMSYNSISCLQDTTFTLIERNITKKENYAGKTPFQHEQYHHKSHVTIQQNIS